MARAPGDHNAASLGQKTMTHTIQCPECGVVLNVPASAAGRKLKCPKCAIKFAAPAFGPADSAIAGSSPASSMFPTRKGPPSSGEFDLSPRGGSSGSIELPTSGPKRGGSGGSIELPLSSGPIGDTYELPLPIFDLPTTKAPAANDALALFQDEPKANRKPKGAEARAKPRRCPSCGGVVGIGMSLCNTCGLDLDTGQRIAPLDVFEDEMPVVHRSEMPAFGVLVVGGIAAMINLLLAVASLVASRSMGSGMLCLMAVWLFGIFASVQFLRRKTIRPLFLALGMGAVIGVIYLIALPIWDANVGVEIPLPEFNQIDPDAPQVQNLADHLDMRRITWGVAMLLSYAALSVYLNSPAVRREFTRK